MKIMKSVAAVFMGTFLGLNSSSYAGSALEDYQKLSPAEQKVIQDGGQVVQYGNQNPWPSMMIYQRINALPVESAAVFFNYGNHEHFIPNVTKSESVAESKTVFNVDYKVKLPFIPESLGGVEVYRMRDELSSYDDGKSFEINWNLVPGHGETTKSTVGYAKFEDLGGATILAYYNYVVPGRFGSDWGFVVNGAKDSVKRAVVAIAKETEKTRSTDLTGLQAEVDKLKEALKN